jgi:hypothetical protein
MKKNLTLFLILISMLMSSCATIFTGTQQTVFVNSTPPGAMVQVNGIDRGTTPVSLRLKKNIDGQVITLKKEGYEMKFFQPETEFNMVSLLNFIIPIYWAIDAATGAMWKYSPEYYEITLEPQKERKRKR